MTPGPTHILGCPGCGALHANQLIGSGNTVGARWWTDGKMEAPMLPEQPAITRCTRCRRIFWVRDAARVGSVEPGRGLGLGQIPPEWTAAARVTPLDGEGYREAVRDGLATTPEWEILLRTRAWWCDNDTARWRPEAWVPFARRPAPERENAERLRELLDAAPAPADPRAVLARRLARAELARQLGRFEEALAIFAAAPGAPGATPDVFTETIAAQARAWSDALVELAAPR